MRAISKWKSVSQTLGHLAPAQETGEQWCAMLLPGREEAPHPAENRAKLKDGQKCHGEQRKRYAQHKGDKWGPTSGSHFLIGSRRLQPLEGDSPGG